MSGLDGLQAATSLIQLAELARETALLIRRVCRAHRDAEKLCQNTQNLAHLLKNVGHILQKRNERHEDRSISEDGQGIEDSIRSSIDLCRSCVEGIRDTFKGLVDANPAMSRMQLRKRIWFVLKQKDIESRQHDIDRHLAFLSVALQCLTQQDQADQWARDAAERQTREQSTRRIQEMHETFLRQLFELLQYAFQQASAGSTAATPQTGPYARRHSQAIGPHDQLAIGYEDPQPMLQDMLRRLNSRQDPQWQFQDYDLNTSRPIEEVETDDDSGVDVFDTGILRLESAEQDLEALDRQLSQDLPQYANITTFFLAIQQGKLDLVRNLLDEGADTTAKATDGWTVLHHAVFCCHEEIVEILLEHRKSQCNTPSVLNAQTKMGETALIWAIKHADKPKGVPIAQMLLKQEACDVNIDDGVGSALYYAVKEGRPTNKSRRSLVQALADRQADVEAVHKRIPDSVSNYDCLARHISSSTTRRNSEATLRRWSTIFGHFSSSKTRRNSEATPRRRSTIFGRFAGSRSGSFSGATSP